MRAVNRFAVPAAAVLAVQLASGTAAFGAASTTPEPPASSSQAGGGSNGRQVTSHVQFSGATGGSRPSSPSRGGTPSSGPLNSADYDPPACWYEPAYTPAQMKVLYGAEKGLNVAGMAFNPIGAPIALIRNKQLDGLYGKDGKYKGFKDTKEGEGMFWAGVVNPKKKDDPASQDCNKDPFWVPKGQQPKDVPLAVTPKILAEAAWGAIDIPGVKLQLSPAKRSTVNLATWAWTDRGKIKPLTVTASLPKYGIWAKTTATPSQLKIDPGTGDATVHPSSGVCTADAQGRIGTPFTKGAKGAPPCGVTYLHASTGGPFQLKGTTTWTVAWEGSDGTGGDLPSGTFGSSQDVDVQEVQSVVSGH